jgi:hypothetical protein
MRRKPTFIADQRGAVSFEMLFVFSLLMLGLLLPLADVAIAGFQYISALQALRGFGQSILYSPPTDLSNTSSWTASAIAKADTNYPVSNFQLICGGGGAACSGANLAWPRYYSYSTTVTLSPLVLNSVLCTSGGGNPCQFTLTYRERFS